MSAVSRSPLSPSSPDSVMQAATELERNSSVSCLHHLFSAFVDDLQTQDSGSGLFANAQNILITDSTIISHSRRLHIFILFVFTRSAAFTMSILAKEH
jgi:hypothetical protein